MEMIRYILSSTAKAAESSEAPPELPIQALIILWGLSGAGIVLLLTWTIRYWGHNPLARCPVRRHRLPTWFVPSQLLIWMFGSFLLMMLVKALFKDSEDWRFELALNIGGIFWYGILLCLFLTVARFGFVRGLKGLGLDWPAVGEELFWGAVTLITVMPLIFTALQATLLIGQWLMGPDFAMDQHAALAALSDFPQWWMQAVIILNAVLVVPVFEEVLFRGLLQSTLTAHLGRPWLSILAVSILFSMMHPYPTHLPALMVLSLGLGYTYEKSGSLLRPIWMHILFNGTNITLALLAA
jgi:membrane protease YdiL (CAAX protease family)